VKRLCTLSHLTPEVVDIFQILRAGLTENNTQTNTGCTEKEKNETINKWDKYSSTLFILNKKTMEYAC
jgi:hypothetical protein